MRRVVALSLLLAACSGAETIADAGADAAADDLAMPPPPGPGPKPLGGTVGITGGSVDRLYFGFTGDTRPSNADDTAAYPTATITSIFTALATADVEFALDLGDHMYVSARPSEAPVQMGFYMGAAKQLGARPLFMTQGNHDCDSGNCFYARTDANHVAYMAALAPVSPLPYYSVRIDTRSGPAVFVFISDNYTGDLFDWLERTLTDADATARYTIVSRHHPLGSTQTSTQLTEQTIRRHKYTLFLTGHYHHYERDSSDASGRTLIYGLGGVPNSGPDFGYGIVQQGLDDQLWVTIYDLASGMPVDRWSVPPQ